MMMFFFKSHTWPYYYLITIISSYLSIKILYLVRINIQHKKIIALIVTIYSYKPAWIETRSLLLFFFWQTHTHTHETRKKTNLCYQTEPAGFFFLFFFFCFIRSFFFYGAVENKSAYRVWVSTCIRRRRRREQKRCMSVLV